MLDKVFQLFYRIYSTDKESYDRGRRLADKAKSCHLSEVLIGACYLYEVLTKNYGFYYETLKDIEATDKDVAYLVDKITKKNTESWKQYYYRISVIPDASKIVYLIMLQELEQADKETFERIYSNLDRVFIGSYRYT